MSAFQCTLTHLCAIVGSYIGTRQYRQYTFEDPSNSFMDEGRLLVTILDKENVRSLDTRYPNHDHERVSGGDDTYIFRDKLLQYFEVNPLTPGEMFKAIGGLEYQSCESNDYYDSDGYRLLRIISKSTQERVQGYEDAPWGMDDMHPRDLVNAPISIMHMIGGKQ